MKRILTSLLVGLIITAVGGLLVSYLSEVYQQPKIYFYNRAYYKIDDISIGNIYLWNGGHRTDKNIAITIDTVIEDKDLKIVDLISPYEIKNNDNKTTIIIKELKPDEAADITFRGDPTRDDFEILSFVSDYSNIEDAWFNAIPKWWQLPKVQIVLVLALFAIGAVSGYWLSKRNRKRHK